MILENTMHNDTSVITQIFNDYFSTVGQNLDQCIPLPNESQSNPLGYSSSFSSQGSFFFFRILPLEI